MTPQELALLGFYIFPCKGKTPLVKWASESTIDESTIRTWEQKYPHCSFGIDCGKSGLLVLDDDRGKKPEAVNSMNALELEYGPLPLTFTVRTQSGGVHYYFYGEGKTSSSTKLGPGLDTRGVGGYVIAPGSPGYEVVNASAIVDAPDWLIELIGKPTERPESLMPVIRTDEDTAVLRAIAFLETAPVAIEGQGGDDLTFRTACRIKDFGVDADQCVYLMERYWNERCIPPWDTIDLLKKVYNAYNYGSAPQGAAAPEAAFSTFIDTAPSTLFIESNVLLTRKIHIEYLIHKLIETPSTGLIFGDPSSGKSFLAISMALAVACGTSWMGAMCRQGVSVYFAGEGRHGVQRRIAAWKKHYSIEIPVNYLWVSERRVEFTEKSLVGVANELKSIQDIAGLPISIMFVDTLARHMPSSADENSARDMGGFINACDWLRDKFNAVAAVVHHSGKMNKSNSRGSSAIRGAMDWEFQVNSKKGVRDITFTKQKESELPLPMGFYLKQVDLGGGVASAVPISCSYDPTHGKVANLSSDAALAYSILQFGISQSSGDCILEKEWRKEFYTALGDDINAETKRQKFGRAKAKLLESVTIRYEADRVYDTNVNEDDSDD